jgi:hypothetical protein
MIVICTGMRDWSNAATIENELLCLENFHGEVFHGDCPTGADAIVKECCDRLGFAAVAFPVDWRLGPSAGPRRNAQMVKAAKLRAAELRTKLLCLAFWDGESKGTLDTIRQATKAGIRVRIIPALIAELDKKETT